ncbi:hypothetical protein KCMC57_up14130 [Kitasatospora sp. CMC57]|uniref:Uncharacterized protein n=1 Tax=Kitasatospora sp. CMC57 TaxID=3231513 RepID=A0AB33JP93_9ACTN
MTDERLDDAQGHMVELQLAWRRAKALWSSDPNDIDAYTAFIQAGIALYRQPVPDPRPARAP